jgi:hypothetical protein
VKNNSEAVIQHFGNTAGKINILGKKLLLLWKIQSQGQEKRMVEVNGL